MTQNIPTKTDENVEHPVHYCSAGINCSCGKPIECIDIIENFEFNLGAAMKYIWRCNHKGKRVEDLKKAIWYLNRAINNTDKKESPKNDKWLVERIGEKLNCTCPICKNSVLVNFSDELFNRCIICGIELKTDLLSIKYNYK